MNKLQKYELLHGTLYTYGGALKEKEIPIPEEIDCVEDICIYAKEQQLSLYYWPQEDILGYMEECYVTRIAERYNLTLNPEPFFEYVNGEKIVPFPEKLTPPPVEESIAVHTIRLDKDNELFCIGSKSAIEKLQSRKKRDFISLVIFLTKHNIYCGIQCTNSKNLIQIPEVSMDTLYGNGLIVDEQLFVEAMILSDLEKSYKGLDILQMTKEELDELVKNTWWNTKFKIK